MKVTVKDLKHNSHELDDVDSEQTVGTFGQTVKELFKFPDGVRLIYCGRILENDKKMSDYFKENNNGFIVCMPHTQPKPPQSTPTQSTPTQSTPTQSQSIQSTPTNSNTSTNVSPNANPTSSTTAPTSATSSSIPALSTVSSGNSTQTYTVDQIRAMMVVFARVLKVSPDLFYMFSTNDAQFQHFMLSPTFSNDILAPLIQSSNMVLTALQNGTDINVPIPIFGRRNNNTNTTTNLNTLNMTTINPGTTGNLPQTHDNNNLFTETEDINTTLTDDDHKNIQELCQFGFPIDIVTQTYILTNRNKELAATMLFEFGG